LMRLARDEACMLHRSVCDTRYLALVAADCK
jgi:hypothetical protein